VWRGRGGIDLCGCVPSGDREEVAQTAEEAANRRGEEAAVGRVEDSDAEDLNGGRRGALGLQRPAQEEGTEERWGGADEEEKGAAANMALVGGISRRRQLGATQHLRGRRGR
jgi:hypothetical protein